MHPLTLYDIAVLEHQEATRRRAREHVVRLRRHERSLRTAGSGGRAASSARPATA